MSSARDLLLDAWRANRSMDDLPAAMRPRDIDAAYALQDAVIGAAGEPVRGYKIAATSAAGQAHIAVSHPISGQLLASRVLGADAVVPMTGNLMRVAEAEFVFEFAAGLEPRERPYARAEVMERVGALRLGIEIPNPRLRDFVGAGVEQLIADNSCAYYFVLGPAVDADWRGVDLARHPVTLQLDGQPVSRGLGGDALGDPRRALTWFANHYRERRRAVAAGSFVTTGVCGRPAPIEPGQQVLADFAQFGSLRARLALDG